MLSQSLAEQYARDIYEQKQLRATWPPGTLVALGTVGELRNGVFTPLDNISGSSYNIAFDTETFPYDDLRYLSQSGVDVSSKLRGKTSSLFRYVAKAQAGIRVKFGQYAASVLSINGVTVQRISNQVAFQKQLRRTVNYDNWKKTYAVVTETYTGASGTIMLCEGRSGTVELSADADITNPLADIGNASLGLNVVHTSGKILTIMGDQPLVPVFRGLRVKENFWTGWVEVGAAGPDEEDDASYPSIDESFEEC